MKYKTKPFIVEAVEWKGDNINEIQNLMYPESPMTHNEDLMIGRSKLQFKTYSGESQFAKKGDFIIKFFDRFEVCKGNDFKDQYEIVED